MATKKKKNSSKMGTGAKILIVVVMLLLLLFLVVGGFFLGIYLRIFDTKQINESLELYKLPVVGEYFEKPEGAELEEESQQPTGGDSTLNKDAKELTKEVVDEQKSKDKKKEEAKKKLSPEEIAKQIKEREAAEKKRISKLARLYNEMKPEEAATIMNDLEDDMTIAILQKMDESVVSQILASDAFGAEHAARITRIMYAGAPKRVSTPEDAQGE